MEIASLEVSMQTLIECKRLPRSTMVRMEIIPRISLNLESSNRLEQVVAVVKVVEMLETLLNMVERVRRFHYLQTFAGDVVKANTRKANLVKHQKQCAVIVPSKDTLRNSA